MMTPIVDETGSEVVVIDEEGTEPVMAGAVRTTRTPSSSPMPRMKKPKRKSSPAAAAEWGWMSLLHIPTR